MTGRMPSVHGVRHNGLGLALEETTFVDVLREAGYHPVGIKDRDRVFIGGEEIDLS